MKIITTALIAYNKLPWCDVRICLLPPSVSIDPQDLLDLCDLILIYVLRQNLHVNSWYACKGKQ